MALVLYRGITRGCHHRSFAIQRFYSTKPSPKTTTDNSVSQSQSEQNKSQKNDAEIKSTDTSHDTSSSSVEKAQQKLAELKFKITESQRKAAAVPENLRGYALDRFVNYIKNYDKVLEKKFPGAMKVYRVFMDGVKLFGRDMVDYIKIRTKMIMHGSDMTSMSRRELEVYYQMPNDIRKAWPFLIVSSIPMAHYITMPIAYMYPRYFLTHHFWTLQQRSEFAVINLRDRLLYNRNVFRDLQSKLEQVKNDDQYEQWSSILGKLGSGLHPTIDEILSVEKLFTEPPYNTKSLNYTHVKHLAEMHGIRTIFFRKSKLAYRAMCIHHIDMAILREGGIQNLATDVLRHSCFMRGLNASNLNNDELAHWLEQWIEVSKHANPNNFSLFLHLPIFLTYNHPNNWKLIYQDRT